MILSELEIGTKLFYTGDIANASDWGEILSKSESPSDGFGGWVEVKFEDGKSTAKLWPSQIGDVYRGHCNPRFVTLEAYQKYFKGEN